MKNVGRHGGKVIGQPMNIPEVGKYVMFFDTEGNKDCLLQPVMRK
jgi:predicted enzyme related to lactoylglutathione lyase